MDTAARLNPSAGDTRPQGSSGLQDPHHDAAGHRDAVILPSVPAYDSVSIFTAGPANDTDSIQTAHLAYETDSNRTINPAFDTDSTHTLHQPYTAHMEGVPGPAGGDGPAGSISLNPPPYSPPDPKTAYLMFPAPLQHYSNQPVIACQPANPPAFYPPSFLPPSTYPSYTIYMNGPPPPPLGEEQQPLPKDYLVESLLVTIFCCIMSGLFAVMYSYETRAALSRGDIREAEKTSQKARLLVMFSLMFGVFIFVGWIVYVVIVLCA
ncbi:proline rich transmembrane protein 1B isoform X2 [Danio rerio]|uniref:Proline rich transmembrane protein 1B isoform X2 n=1 Tax=Danio rerio TaxID=7955 RepID=A0A8M3BBJ6_DANRE|nr:proline-rich transmembrane protein 1 [Danio rerio]|eukprot:XP_009301986.1 proline-rich transmembrane protein 1 [Danio rerio]